MRKTIFALCCVLAAGTVTAQGKAYHDDSNPNTATANTFPFGNAFGNNWRYQVMVPASSLPNTPVRITEFSFAPTASGTFQVQDFELSMGHGTGSTLSTIFANNFTTGPVPMISVLGTGYSFQATANTWTTLGVQTPFDYDGVSPLVIEIRYRGMGTMNQGTTSIRAKASSSNSIRLWANNITTPTTPDPYAAVAGRAATSGAIKVCLDYVSTQVTLAGTTRPGGTVDLNLLSPSNPGKIYQAASSLGTGPIVLGSRQINLTPDDLMVVTTGNLLPTIFQNYAGALSAQGTGLAHIKILNDARLIGVRIHSAFIVLDQSAPFGIGAISNTASFSITS